MCSLLCFRVEEVTLNLAEELFRRWVCYVALLSAYNEATIELINVFFEDTKVGPAYNLTVVRTNFPAK